MIFDNFMIFVTYPKELCNFNFLTPYTKKLWDFLNKVIAKYFKLILVLCKVVDKLINFV